MSGYYGNLLGALFGYGGTAFKETLDPGIDRANVQFLLPLNSRLYVTKRTRKELAQKFEWLWQNFGVVKHAIDGINRHVIGKGVSLQIDAEDEPEQCEAAEQDFENYALSPERCDLSGRRNFYEMEGFAIEQRLGRGEFFTARATNPQFGTKDNPEPCFQIYDSESIGNPMDIPDGTNIIDGCEYNSDSRTIAHWVRSLDGSYTRMERGRMLHWFKPHAVDQCRGITDFAQAVNPMVDIHELKRLATRSAKAQQLLALMMKGVRKTRKKGAIGAIRQAGVDANGEPDADQAQLESLFGAAGAGIVYVDDENGDVKVLESKTPNPLVEPYVTDLLLRDACSSWGLPVEFFWNPQKLNGNTLRAILARADLFFQVIGSQACDRVYSPLAYDYLQHRITIGKLKPFKDPDWMFKLTWQMPPRVTVDNQREAQIAIDMLRNGMGTLREFYNARGLSAKSQMRQWIREIKQFIELCKQEKIEPKYLDRIITNLPLWRAPEPGQGMPTADQLAAKQPPKPGQKPSKADT